MRHILRAVTYDHVSACLLIDCASVEKMVRVALRWRSRGQFRSSGVSSEALRSDLYGDARIFNADGKLWGNVQPMNWSPVNAGVKAFLAYDVLYG